MIQKLRKAQALTEMAIFGTLILLCLYYLLSYLQRLNERQYVAQEAFRSALARAHDGGVGSVSYSVFSNRRSTSINAPVIGERGQASGSAQIYWGTPPISYSETGEVTTGDLSSLNYYKFNSDIRELSGILSGEEGGAVEFSSSSLPALAIELNANYDGVAESYTGQAPVNLDNLDIGLVPGGLGTTYLGSLVDRAVQENNRNNEDLSGNQIVIRSDERTQSSLRKDYGSTGIRITQRGVVQDRVIYMIEDEEGNLLYAIEQGLGPGGDYSHANVNRQVENVMLPSGQERQWTVSK